MVNGRGTTENQKVTGTGKVTKANTIMETEKKVVKEKFTEKTNNSFIYNSIAKKSKVMTLCSFFYGIQMYDDLEDVL